MTAVQETTRLEVLEAEQIDLEAARREEQLQPFRNIIDVVSETAAADYQRSEDGQDPQRFSARASAVLNHAKTALRVFHADPSKVHDAGVHQLANDAVNDTNLAINVAKDKISAIGQMEDLFLRALPFAVEDQAYNNRAKHMRSAQRSITTGEQDVSEILRNVTEQIAGLQESDIAIFNSSHGLAAITPEMKELVATLKALRTRDLNDDAKIEAAKQEIHELETKLKEKQSEIDHEKANLGNILLQNGAGTNGATESLNQQAKLEEEKRALQDKKDKAVLKKHEAESDRDAVKNDSQEPGEKIIASRRLATQYVHEGVAALIPVQRFEGNDLRFYGSASTPTSVAEALKAYQEKLAELQVLCGQSKDERHFSNDQAVLMVDLAQELFIMHGVHLNALRQTLLEATSRKTVEVMGATMDRVARTEDTSLNAHTGILHSEAEVIASIRGELAGIRELYVAEHDELVATKEELEAALHAYRLGGMSLRAALEEQRRMESGIEQITAGKKNMAKNHRRMVTFRAANRHIDLSKLGAGDEGKIFEAASAEVASAIVKTATTGEKIAKEVAAIAYGKILTESNDVLNAREADATRYYESFRQLGDTLARAILSSSTAGVEQARLATSRFLGMGELFSQTAETVVDLPGVALIDLVSKQYLNDAARAVLADATGEGKPIGERLKIAGRVVQGKPLSARISSNSGPLEALAITTAARTIGTKR